MKIKKHPVRIITDSFIFMEDGGEGLTIENDVDFVLKRLKLEFGLNKRRVFYKDSFGIMCEIYLEDGHFAGFGECSADIILKVNNYLSGGFIAHET